MFIGGDVYACGEIKELRSSIGTVAIKNDSTYVVTVPEGTNEVTLEGTTDYTWVTGYEPRKVSTKNGRVELQVDGNACGYGIYTYYVEFKELSNIIAENEPSVPTDPSTEVPSTSVEGGETTTTTPETEINYGVLPLTRLEIDGIDFEFDPEQRVYNLEVDGNVKKLNIDAYTEDTAVTISISDSANDLKEGANVVIISLSDPYKNTGVYILNIEKTKPKSSNNFLESLTVDKYQLNFDPSISSYVLEIGKESTLNIVALPQSKEATVAILGNTNLSDGDEITIRVAAEDKTTRDYKIIIKRVFNIMDYWVYIVIVMLILLILIIMLIIKQKKNKKKMGPQTLEGQANTAGVIQEIAPQNQTAGIDTNAEDQNGVQASNANPGVVGKLKIIEPTNLETPPDNNPVSEDDSPTEVFQL